MAKKTPTILPEFHGETDDWNVYQEILDEFFRANGITGKDRVPVLISVIGKATYGTLRSLCHPKAAKDMSYEELCSALARQFIPEIAIFRHRAQFYRAEQQRGESVKEWYARLKSLSMECKFNSSLLEPLMIDRFVIGLLPGPVKNRLHEEPAENLTDIDDVVTMAASKEADLRVENEGDDIAQGFAGLVIGDGRHCGRRYLRYKKLLSPEQGWKDGQGRHGRHGRHRHHRHGRHRHHQSDSDSGPEHHHGHHGRHGHHGHHEHHGHMKHPGRHFGPPAFGPAPWSGPARHYGPMAGPWMGGRIGKPHPFGASGWPGMMEGLGRQGRPCGKWRKRHYHRRSSSSSSGSSSDSSTSSSGSSSSNSDSDAPTDEEMEKQVRKYLRRKLNPHFLKRHGGRGRHHRHHHHHHHHRDEENPPQDGHGKRGCRRNRKQQDEPSAPALVEEVSPNEPTTDPELIE
ncbi:sarcoplasmic reticulum histidine-rich calcium-binding protein-like [Anopheles stephensi]|uniref:sarcoplasmic reticulum histidine-rich calcium-binding protein-like n=1 Tax=Anopheles stephensi TaxID=30069 RepID=UPI0007D4ACBD|nr:sarcoplasmic reticulum histidine-rich calcium-binding protein-like [Anopheles stephensi]